jgi:hypothetical protein
MDERIDLMNFIYIFTFIRPSRAAGPFSANFNINNGIENSRPPRILNPKLEFGYGR